MVWEPAKLGKHSAHLLVLTPSFSRYERHFGRCRQIVARIPTSNGDPDDRVLELMEQGYSIVADDRERCTGVVAALECHPNVLLRVERLPLGDYRVDDMLLVERKTLIDLTASIKDGRLFTQGLRLANAPLRGVMILEGRPKDLAGSRMRREAIRGALVTLTVFFGIPVLRSIDPGETAGLILTTARQARTYARGALRRPGHRPKGKPRTQSRILQSLPGIGPERARRLIERFGSIEAVVTASTDDLAYVPGIGKATANAIRWAVEERAETYDTANGWDHIGI